MQNMKVTTNPPGGAFAKGGDNKMFGFRGTGTQESGQSSSAGTGSKRGIEPKAGGQVAFVSDNSKHGREMTQKHGSNTDYAGTATSGGSGPTKSGGDKNSFAKGGNTPMHGNTGSRRAEPGCSSAQ
jgi:hypothetical protein